MKRIFSVFLIIFLCLNMTFNFSVFTFADESETEAETDNDTENSSGSGEWPEAPEINGTAAVLIEASTGTVLYEKNAHDKMYPASITKILTGILTIENCSLSETVTFSESAVNIPSDASNIEAQEGEEMSVKDCLYGLLLASGNEVANALAEHVAGSTDAFAEMMNEWATEAGATDSHFANPSGLHDENHYITAYDMAMIAKRAIKNPVFLSITGTCEHIISPTNKTDTERELNMTHKMVWSGEYSSVAYDGVLGGKTGYTDEAGTTLVTYAERDGMTLICVVLNSNSYNVYYDTADLFDYGFDNFTLYNISENESMFSGTSNLSGVTTLTSAFSTSNPLFEISSDDYIVLPNTASFSDTEVSASLNDSDDSDDDSAVATLTYTYAGKTVGTTTVIQTSTGSSDSESSVSDDSSIKAEEAVETTATVSFKDKIKAHSSLITKIVVAIIVIIIIIIIIRIIRKKFQNISETRTQKRTRYR